MKKEMGYTAPHLPPGHVLWVAPWELSLKECEPPYPDQLSKPAVLQVKSHYHLQKSWGNWVEWSVRMSLPLSPLGCGRFRL